MKFLSVSYFFLFSIFQSFSQGEANNWYFGYNSGISFASGSPVLLNDGAMSTDEGCASISDASGNLLFYTDGVNVYNRIHQLMPNGTGLLGSPSSTQSGVIIKQPGASSIYYIFTTPAPENGYVNGLRYSEIDMTLDGGNGDVTLNKNILLQTPTCEKITGVRHENNQDIWLISHDTGSNQFRTFLITSAGINLTPVISSVGEIVLEDPASFHVAGQLKAYLGGKKIAAANYTSDNFELFDFDNATGILSNPILLDNDPGGAYGVEFSPDGTKLYGSIIAGTIPGQPLTENLYQWNLCAGTLSATDIINSKQLIFSGSGSDQGMGSMQLAPDGKIYVARYNGLPPGDPNNTHYLGVINDPNAAGIACNYVDDGFFLGAMTSGVGLPNFVPYNLNTTPPPILTFSYDSILCKSNQTSDPIFVPNFASGGIYSCTDPNLVIDPNTGQLNLAASSTGTFSVKYELVLSACGIQSYDTTVQVIITDLQFNSSFSLATPACNFTNSLAPILDPNFTVGGTFSSSQGLVMNPITGVIDVAQSSPGSYTVTYSVNGIGCISATSTGQTITIVNSAIADFSVNPSSSLKLLETEANFINTSMYANSYLWDFGDGTSSTEVHPIHVYDNELGEYEVQLIAYLDGACNDTTKLIITIIENDYIYVPNTFTPNDDELNQVFKPVISSSILHEGYSLLIFNRWGELLFESHDKNVGWDGTYHTYLVKEGMYVWNVELINSDQEKILKQGHVTLFR